MIGSLADANTRADVMLNMSRGTRVAELLLLYA
jgi:hypothetical protein